MSLRLWLVAAVLVTPTVLIGCEEPDPCALAPNCEENTSVNCDYNCAGCSGTPDIQPCGSATCQIAGGDRSSVQFFRDRAVCVVPSSGDCDPAAFPAPTCSNGIIQGCSAYRRVIQADCGNAARYFANISCCTQGGGNGDGGP